jgi:GAF domain-containing protein
LGVLDVQSDVINRFTEEDVRIKTTLAGQIAVALENARLFEQTRARARREQILREVTVRVRGSIDADAIMRTAVQEVGRALGRPAFVYLDDEKKQPNHESEM